MQQQPLGDLRFHARILPPAWEEKRRKRRNPRRMVGTWGSSTILRKWMTTLAVLVQVLVGGRVRRSGHVAENTSRHIGIS
jgi:hypothetical protein